MFCYGCGNQISPSAAACPQCGAPQKPVAGVKPMSPARTDPLPPGVEGWSWGGFLLNGIWAIGNRTWIGLLAFIPIVGLVMSVVLGIKGRAWAWQSGRWQSVEHFNAVQRKWSIAGFVFAAVLLVLGVVGGIGLAMYEEQQSQQAYHADDGDNAWVMPESESEPEAVSVSDDGTITYSDGTSFNPGDVECEEGVCE